ncbi:hypothetical protein [Lentilactobacillus sp. SPB1-3]|uniref:Uncharacterized protein n=1 Tax=Lentilactobacillus terminaliae TaxID=3003483 RepID=A0ACD5DC60_9LACO|nr:hypothetical protein [Lentilactobacillus sp. SPB1-3]MCZ0977142.1 hypothetical protein [Lentilactobacillus sp. SPB1-3]
MDLIQQLNLGSTAELMITVLVVFCITQAFKTTSLGNHYLPWIAMFVGVVAGIVAVAATGDSNYVASGVMGLLVGGFTCGLFDGFKGFKQIGGIK